jgi:membrane-bound ClpP family serine protease
MAMQPAEHRACLYRLCFALAVVAIALPGGVAAAEDDKPAAETRIGCTVRVALPITGATTERVRRFVDRALSKYPPDENRLVLIFEFEVPPKQAEYGRGSKFGFALVLADLLTSKQLQGVHTVAYVPQSIQGHAVLAVMACDEIVMAKDATLGLAGIDDAAVAMEATYREIANRRRTIPAEVALWMLDKSREVLVVDTIEAGRQFVAPAALAELKKKQTVKPSPRKLCDPLDPQGSAAAEPGLLTGNEAWKLGFVTSLAERRVDLANALDVPPQDVEEDPGMVGELKAFQVNLTGLMNSDLASRAERMMIEAVEKKGANFICLWIDSPGGSVDFSLQLANAVKNLDRFGSVRTVAYIPDQARADAALVALACTEVAMASNAVLGGPGAREFSQDDLAMMREAVADPKGPWRLRPWPLVAAMVDPDLTVHRCRRAGETVYLSQKELDAYRRDLQAKPWHEVTQITVPREQFKVDGTQAVEYRLAARTVGDFAEFKRAYNLENDPAIVAPGWADTLVDWLTSDLAKGILLVVGFLALYIELHSPGIGLGAFVALVCFAVFFSMNVLGGTAGWLEITLFVVGICCVLVEVFVLPGFGVFGLGGGILVLTSLVLASQTFVFPHNSYQFARLERSLLTIAGAAAGFVAAAIAIRHWLPRAPVVNQMFLEPPTGAEAEDLSRRESLVDLGDLLGTRGTTTTQLTPSGKARFGNRLVDVISDGDLIARGTEIEVVEVHGARVVVKAVGSGQ